MNTCKDCGRHYKLRHIKCSKKQHMIQPIDQHELDNTKLFNLIKSKLTYECKWSDDQINKTINYLVCSLMLDRNQNKYPIKLDDISSMLGYTQIRDIKKLMVDSFQENIDYALLALGRKQNKTGRGGSNKQIYGLTISCAKRLCMLSKTKQSNNFRMYFIIIEDLFKECIRDPSLLPVLDNQEKIDNSVKHIQFIESNKNQSVIYVLQLLDYPSKYKYGQTTDLEKRLKKHTNTFGRYRIITIVNMSKCVALQVNNAENAIAKLCIDLGIHSPFVPTNKKRQVEIFETDTIDPIMKAINECISQYLIPIDGGYEIKKLDKQIELKKLDIESKRLEIQLEQLRLMERPQPPSVDQIHREWIENNHPAVDERLSTGL